MLSVSDEDIKNNKHRFPAYFKRNEIEVRLLLERVIETDPAHPLQKRYRTYVRTMHWRALKTKRLSRAGNKCEQCHGTNKLEVHHINYKNLYDATLDDLKVMCHECHNSHHSNYQVS